MKQLFFTQPNTISTNDVCQRGRKYASFASVQTTTKLVPVKKKAFGIIDVSVLNISNCVELEFFSCIPNFVNHKLLKRFRCFRVENVNADTISDFNISRLSLASKRVFGLEM